MRAAALGFAVGLFAGIALAFLIGQFDTRVRTYRDASEILGLPVIGRLPRLPRSALAKGGIVTLSEPGGAFAESVRMMRGNLSWSAVAGEWKSLLITSARQGEGKSLTLCNLAVALALAGNKVVVVDADLRAPRVHRYFGLANVTGLTTVVANPQPVQTCAEGLQPQRSTQGAAADRPRREHGDRGLGDRFVARADFRPSAAESWRGGGVAEAGRCDRGARGIGCRLRARRCAATADRGRRRGSRALGRRFAPCRGSRSLQAPLA